MVDPATSSIPISGPAPPSVKGRHLARLLEVPPLERLAELRHRRLRKLVVVDAVDSRVYGARARVQCPRRCGLIFCGRACQRSADARGHADGCGPFDARTRRMREARAVVDDYKTRKTRSFRKKQSAATYDAKVRKVATCLRRFEVCARQPWAACAAGTAVYAAAAALPHACAPALRMFIDDGTLTATAARDLAENQLLTVNLGPPQLPEWGRDVRRRWLRDHHGFACECATCART